MPTIEVEAELDDFDTDDLIRELKSRWRRMSDKEKGELSLIMNNAPEPFFDGRNLNDRMKLDHITEVFNKYTLAHIQSVLP